MELHDYVQIEREDKDMYIITNTCLNGEYTPSKAETLKEARAWLFECTANNIRVWKGDEYPELYNMSDEEVLEWAEENLSDFSYNDDSSEIYYDDDSYNIMNIYDLDKI